MRIRVSSPNSHLRTGDIDQVERDLEKLGRRLREFDDREEVMAEVRIKQNEEGPNHQVTLELSYGRHHLRATCEGGDIHQMVREARDEILRQINDRSRGGHSQFVKGR